ncbi:pyridoxal phosphate-dependent decarboxylase family protein [Shewanella donghaensis]|uniref:pyridoxal phosphate-dependent decarboxylase family protein n=1 Tax=Shewanella donghaensis TaxID=238836 RepID=UPI0011838787|nr:aminotransferase class I/II-fold pyridoxal phosphate-dependent enzyme [Shewanella donghaensis]
MTFTQQTNQQLFDAFKRQFDEFHNGLPSRNVASKTLEIATEPLPENGSEFSELVNYIDSAIQPNLSASNGGRYWGFVTGGANPVATYADWLVTTYNQNVAKGGDSIASSIERQALSWLCQLFELPDSFKGIVTTGATSANLLGAFTARQFTGMQQGINVALEGMSQLDVAIFSATPHASMVKSLGMAGFGQNSWHKVDCLAESEAMDVNSLEQQLVIMKAENSPKSIIVIASAATVTGTDYDDLIAISNLCKRYNAWLHVDAAFGIFERLMHGAEGKTKGLEFADSITLDCHKWLNVPYDCGVFLTQHQGLLQASCEVDAPYMMSDANEVAFMSLGIENSRRFRAFPVWATLKAYGKEGIKAQVSRNVAQAKQLAQWLEASDLYELVKPCELNVVLFKPKANLAEESLTAMSANECMLKLNQTGEIFFTPGVWNGEPIIRAAISNWVTTEEDMQTAIRALGH